MGSIDVSIEIITNEILMRQRHAFALHQNTKEIFLKFHHIRN